MDCQKDINDSISNINYDKTRRVYENEVLGGTTSKDFRRLEDLLKQQLPDTDHQIEGLAESEYQCIFGIDVLELTIIQRLGFHFW